MFLFHPGSYPAAFGPCFRSAISPPAASRPCLHNATSFPLCRPDPPFLSLYCRENGREAVYAISYRCRAGSWLAGVKGRAAKVSRGSCDGRWILPILRQHGRLGLLRTLDFAEYCTIWLRCSSYSRVEIMLQSVKDISCIKHNHQDLALIEQLTRIVGILQKHCITKQNTKSIS